MRLISEVKSVLSMVRAGKLGIAGNAIAFSVATTLPFESAMPTMALVVVPLPAVLEVVTPVTGSAALVTLMAVPSLAMADMYLPLSALPPETDWSAPFMASPRDLIIFSFVEAAVASCSVRVVQSSETAPKFQ